MIGAFGFLVLMMWGKVYVSRYCMTVWQVCVVSGYPTNHDAVQDLLLLGRRHLHPRVRLHRRQQGGVPPVPRLPCPQTENCKQPLLTSGHVVRLRRVVTCQHDNVMLLMSCWLMTTAEGVPPTLSLQNPFHNYKNLFTFWHYISWT